MHRPVIRRCSFNPGNQPCNGFAGVLEQYRQIVPHVKLAGPTSFAPIIETAIEIVENSGGHYHILLVIADGQDASYYPHRAAQSDFSVIADNFNSLGEVKDALRVHGLESSNLIVGVDFTKSNEWTGKMSFHGRSLHDLEYSPNPYEQAISIIGRTLHEYDDDNMIPCFGFGDASTGDQMVFSFSPGNQPCNGFSQVLQRYRQIVPRVKFAGPTPFAPIIETAIEIVENSGGHYHILLIIADGQVTRGVETRQGLLSQQEKEIVEVIIKASKYALSIVLVGVGDGPWYTMERFDDNIPARAFDNFQFVNFTDFMSRKSEERKKEAAFALAALMEIPLQFKATMELGLLGCRKGIAPRRTCLPPPSSSRSFISPTASSSFEQNPFINRTPLSPYLGASMPSSPYWETSSHSLSSPNPSQFLSSYWSYVHSGLVCSVCGELVDVCPRCQSTITTKIRLRDR